MKKYLKRFGVIFLIIFAVIGIQGGFSASAAVKVGEQLLQPEDGWRRYDDNDSNIVYDDKWEQLERDPNTYPNVYNNKYHVNEKNHVVQVGAKIKFEFKGTKLRILSWKNKDCSGANIKIDGNDYGDFCDYCIMEKKGGCYLFFEKLGLSNSEHRVEITTLDKSVIAKDATNSYFALDAIDIDSDGELVPYTEKKPEVATGILLNKTTDSLNVGETDNLVATVTPDDASNKNVKWTTSDASVATVDENGKVTAVKEGKVKITATTTDGSNLSASCEVTVSPKDIPAIAISLNKTKDSLKVGEIDNLEETVIQADATNKKVKWTTSDEGVATVDENGKVTAVKEGTAIITVTTTDGTNLSETCEVTVSPKDIAATGISLNKTTDSLNVGENDTLLATVTPDDASNKNVKWTTSDASVATVDENGKVTAVKEGTAIITATTEDGNLSDACTVTVNEVQKNSRAVLTITMSNNTVKKYDLSMEELNKFLDWYYSGGKECNCYVFENTPLQGNLSSKSYIPYSKIEFFDVDEYKVK